MAKLLSLVAGLSLVLVQAAAGQSGKPLPENDRVRVVAAIKTDCYIYQADCLRITVECKRFLPLQTPVVQVSWHDADGTAFYTVVKHVAGTAHCNKGDLIHRYAPWYEGKTYKLTLP
jgi:hypothetical protein